MNAQQLKSSILQLAVQGKLIPQDSHDEPASVLLERIAKERERLIKEKKIKKPKNTSHIFRRDGHFYESLNGGQPTCIDEELPFDIPDSWEWVRFSNLVNFSIGKTPPRKESEYWENSIIPWVAISDMPADGMIKTTKEKVSSYAANRTFKGRISPPGTLLMSFKLTVGKVSILDIAAFHNEAIISIFPFLDDDKVITSFLFKILPLVSQIGDTKAAIKGNTLNSDSLSKLLVPLPPFQEQHRIAQKIDKLLSHIEEYGKHEDELSKLNKSFPDSLKKSLLQWAIQGKLVPQDENDEPASTLLERIAKERAAKLGKKAAKSMSRIERHGRETYEIFPDGTEKDISEEIPFDIPDSWEWCRLEKIAMLGAGLTPLKSKLEYYNNGTIPWLQTGNLNDGYITDIPTSVSSLALNETSLKLKPAGSVLIAMYGATIGKLGILTFPSTMNQACCCIEPYANTHNKYIFYYFYAMRQKLRDSGEGGAQPNISKEKLVMQIVPLPPLQEQHRIVEKLDALLKLVDVTK